MKKILIFIFFIFIFSFEVMADSNLKRENEILKNIRCIVCQGQSVADSNSEFAQTIKLLVKEKISDGSTKQEIYKFLIDRYGEWIIFDTQLNKKNFMLWFLPYLTLFLGGIIILRVIRKRVKK